MAKSNRVKISLSTSWVGKIFSSYDKVVFSDSSIAILDVHGGIIESFAYSEILSFPEIRYGLFSDALELSLQQTKYEIKHLRKSDSRLKWQDICDLLVPSITRQVNQIHHSVSQLTQAQYLRDSDITQVEKLCSSISRIPEAHAAKFLSNVTQQKIIDIKRCLPTTENAENIRDDYEKQALTERGAFYDRAESNPLTVKQRQAVIRNNDYNLVLAAAGTGKTSVMVAKSLDLIGNQQVDPDEILVLAYNNAAAKELLDRLETRAASLGIEKVPLVRTFHAFGREILKKARVSVALSVFVQDSSRLEQWVTAWLTHNLERDISILEDVLSILFLPINPFSFTSIEEYEKFVRDTEFRTLNNELVKGYQELLIANWLYRNGIRYSYEKLYESKVRVEEGVDYRPDFYLDDADIYLEHFGISRDGSTRPDICAETYNRQIIQKRALHQEHGTKLIETYHYDWVEKNLTNRLQKLMAEHNVKIQPITDEQLFEQLHEAGTISRLAKVLLDALQAIRVEHLDKEKIIERIEKFNPEYASWCGNFLIALLTAYENELRSQNSIDYDDMILLAQNAINEGDIQPGWRHILVDEFQDISTARLSLIKTLIAKGPRPILTAVGDDWQSIYRFSGGKLEITTRFDEYLGKHTLTSLDKTFRYNNSIAHTAGTFVMKNPEQYKKQIQTHEVVDTPQVYLLDTLVKKVSSPEQRVSQVIKAIRANDEQASIAVISRYKYILESIKNQLKTDELTNNVNLWTFHKSKGLEADYCVIVGFFQGKSGFPNENKGNYVVEALLPTLDEFRHSEERRLLYVGLTRAKKKSYLIADPRGISSFIQELLAPIYNIHIASDTFEGEYQRIFKCPKCTEGFLRMHQGPYGAFYSCTTGRGCKVKPRVCNNCSSPTIDNWFTSICNNPACNNQTPICDKCGRPMKKRNGKFGTFWGCSGYGIKNDQCRHTRKWLS